MLESNWLESKKKSGRKYSVFIVIVAVVAAIIFFINNRETLFAKSGKTTHTAGDTLSRKMAAKRPPVVSRAIASSAAARPSVIAASVDSVMLADISCRLQSREALAVVLSLELFFPPGILKREILLKRENLKVMVQKTIAGKSINELIVDSLRKQTKRAMNRILEKGAIADVEFRHFSIEKVH